MRLLVIRTSAMGDVALTVPVLKGMREQFPDIELVLLTRPLFSPFFTSVKGLILFHPEFNKRHHGIIGLFRLFSDLKKIGRFDYIIDLHSVIRSRFLGFLFRVSGVKVKSINKGRREKRQAIRGRNNEKLQHSVERYSHVFSKAGFKINLNEGPWIIPAARAMSNVDKIIGVTDNINIGVAPYAKHYLKIWPEENMIRLLEMITKKYKVRYWLFGGKEESEKLMSFQKRIPDSVNLCGKLKLEEEIALMTKLDFMISMDSSNMHMAALSGIKVISIWGATDPITGFGAWGQPDEYSVRIPVNELTCRPCTIYGKGECRRKDHACMVWLTPDKVFEALLKLNILR